jgi:hypothetical protein
MRAAGWPPAPQCSAPPPPPRPRGRPPGTPPPTTTPRPRWRRSPSPRRRSASCGPGRRWRRRSRPRWTTTRWRQRRQLGVGGRGRGRAPAAAAGAAGSPCQACWRRWAAGPGSAGAATGGTSPLTPPCPRPPPAGASDLRTKAEVAAAREAKAAARSAAVLQRGERFESAVQKANWASQMLRNQPAAGAEPGDVADPEADDELLQSLQRARRMALAKDTPSTRSMEQVGGGGRRPAGCGAALAAEPCLHGRRTSGRARLVLASRGRPQRPPPHLPPPRPPQVASQLGQRREEDEARLKQELSAGVKFTETTEFVSGPRMWAGRGGAVQGLAGQGRAGLGPRCSLHWAPCKRGAAPSPCASPARRCAAYSWRRARRRPRARGRPPQWRRRTARCTPPRSWPGPGAGRARQRRRRRRRRQPRRRWWRLLSPWRWTSPRRRRVGAPCAPCAHRAHCTRSPTCPEVKV